MEARIVLFWMKNEQLESLYDFAHTKSASIYAILS